MSSVVKNVSEVAIALGAIELASKLVELLRARQQAAAELLAARTLAAADEARSRMDAAHAAAMAVHWQLQRVLTTETTERTETTTVAAGETLGWIGARQAVTGGTV